MKKFLMFLLILFIGFGGYILYDTYFANIIPKLIVEDEVAIIDEMYIYGTHLNIHGSRVNDNNLDFVLYNGEFLDYDILLNDNGFSFSENINDGLYLDNIPVGEYYLFLRSSNKDEENNDVYKYYRLQNNTKYDEITYYTLSNVGNKILINTEENEYGTLMINVSKNADDNIYDVVIDPGHGGMDGGASKNGYKETDFTMNIAMSLKKKMEAYGVKVKLTREDNQLSKDEVLNDYGKGGRAVINHEVNAKYLFSIHLNSNASSSVHGLEVYTAANINYDFAKKLANNIVNTANTNYSNNKMNKIFDGIYTRTFSNNDITSSLDEYDRKNMKAYDITTKSNYYFMIRETGGIMTGAYVDDRNKEKVPGNPYFDSNIGSEAYLFELGYLSNVSDVNNIKNNMDKYTDAIANTFKDIFINE